MRVQVELNLPVWATPTQFDSYGLFKKCMSLILPTTRYNAWVKETRHFSLFSKSIFSPSQVPLITWVGGTFHVSEIRVIKTLHVSKEKSLRLTGFIFFSYGDSILVQTLIFQHSLTL